MEIETTPPVAPHFLGLSKHRPDPKPNRQASSGKQSFDWGSLVPRCIHPIKVAIIEAMSWIDQPLSATELRAILGKESFGLGTVAYHVNTLAQLGVIEATHQRQVRGARETYYFLST